MVPNEFNGYLNKGKSTPGKICVPVLINQPAFITDQVHTTAAIMVAGRITDFRGQQKQVIARTTSTASNTAISARTQPKYSLSRALRWE
ncbi:hypothetical protein ES703_76859 [subsurface metagenome]